MNVLVLEAADQPGGRMTTDTVDGYVVDHAGGRTRSGSRRILPTLLCEHAGPPSAATSTRWRDQGRMGRSLSSYIYRSDSLCGETISPGALPRFRRRLPFHHDPRQALVVLVELMIVVDAWWWC